MSPKRKRKRLDEPHPVTRLDHMMIALAADRAVVQLSTGQTARLIAWKPRRAGGHGRRMNQHCRVEFPGGGRATLPIRQVAGIVNDDGAVHYLEGAHGEEVHAAGGGGASGNQLPTAGQLRQDRRDSPGVRGAPGDGQRPRDNSRGAGSGDRGRPVAPIGAGDPQRVQGRSPMGASDRKGAQ